MFVEIHHIYIILRISVLTWLKLFREIIAAFSENYTILMGSLCEHEEEMSVIKHFRATLTVANTNVGGQPAVVRGSRRSDTA
jgi:hypothetical protein